MKLNPMARGWAIFLGLYFLANVAGAMWRAQLDSAEWVLNFAGLPMALERVVMTGSAVALLGFGLASKSSRLAAAMVALALGISILNVVQFYRLLWVGWISTSFPVPLSLFIGGLLGLILYRLLKRTEADSGYGLAFLNFACALALFPMAQMLFFGTTDYSRKADAIVVFGARTYADGRPSDALKDRVRTACDLYKAGLAPTIVMSGGPGEGAIHETEAMRNYAILKGVPARDIVLDKTGLNTAATMHNMDELARSRGWHRMLAVSHGYHLPRVKLASQRHGLTVFTVPARSPQFLAKLPFFMARETAGWWVYFFREGVRAS